MPSMRYMPNSRLRRLMIKRFAYTTKKPRTHATATLKMPIIMSSSSSIRRLLTVIAS